VAAPGPPGPDGPAGGGPAADGRPGSGYAARPWLSSYPAGVPADLDVPDVPMTQLLDDAAASWPRRTALAFLGSRTSYRDLQESVDTLATALAGLGVRKGDRVAVVLPNCPQNVITTFAALRLGAIVVQHNPLYTETELRRQLVDCGAAVVVCLDRVYDTVARVRRDTRVQHVVVTSLADYLPAATRLTLHLPLPRNRRARAELTAGLPPGAPVKRFLDLLKGAGQPSRQTPVDPATDVALLQYTGGTSGASKGAMLTHRNLVANAYMNRLWDSQARAGEEVCLGVLPLFHVYGLTVCLNATMLVGGTLVLLPRFDLDLLFEAIDRWKPTMFPAVPPIYKAISDSPKARSHDLGSIRVCVSGAMRLPVDVQQQFERISGARLVEGYGLTETSPSTHCTPLTGIRKAGSIGVPLPGTEARIVEADDPTREVPPGQPGELAVRGPQVFSGYWGLTDREELFTDDGYLLTGDIAVMDDDGFFTVVDRKKELIIAGGFNIYPSEVEEVLSRLPGVADCVVVGVPDRYRGETVKAFVVREPGTELTESDVVAACARELSAYKVPKVVEWLDELPRSAVGKVLRRVLLEQERESGPDPAAPPASVPGGVRKSEPGPERSRPT
jgi:long-chain acyl-CoA synthetase